MVIIGNCGGNGYGTNDAGPHAVLTAGDVDYGYDGVGNMVTAVDASANTTTYGYDDLYHLTGVDFPAGDDLAMVYDADGMRVSRTEGDTTITYVGGLFEVEDGGTTTTLRTHYTFGGDHIAVRVDDGSTDTLTYQFTDHLGSIATTYQAGTAGDHQPVPALLLPLRRTPRHPVGLPVRSHLHRPDRRPRRAHVLPGPLLPTLHRTLHPS